MESQKQKTKNLKGRTLAKSAMTDERFTDMLNDPIYRKVPRNEKRVDIDRRFRSMFHDKRFKLKSTIDKRGRPISLNSSEDLRRYYNLIDDDDDGDDNEKSDRRNEKSSSCSSKFTRKKFSEAYPADSEFSKEKLRNRIMTEEEIDITYREPRLSKTDLKKLHDSNFDYARGEEAFQEDSSSDKSSSDDSSSEDEDSVETTHAWGELDKDVEKIEKSSRRLALCNMDWDKVKAVDLTVLFHSFLPAGGVLNSVNIYVSDYGKARLVDEDINGPLELRNVLGEESDSSSVDLNNSGIEGFVQGDDEGRDEGENYHMEKLRKYQLNRLRYYYAVLEFDSATTAEKIYSECDGMEYESSATRVDLRFIPDDMTFDDEPTDSCDCLPAAEKYRPRYFNTTALQQAKVELTWDETDPLRQELTKKIHNPKEKICDEDLRAYLASSDSEDEAKDTDSKDLVTTNSDPLSKYRALLESIEGQEEMNKEKQIEMEITWGVGLKANTESLVKKKLEQQNIESLTPWEEILEKKRERRKEQKAQRRADNNDRSGLIEKTSDLGENAFSDDDVEVDMSDPFFRDEIESNEVMKMTGHKKRKIEESKQKQINSDNNAALELLLMNDADDKHHFSLKRIIQAEAAEKSEKKKRRKGKRLPDESKASIPDTFEMDTADSRFSALFTSHLYNVDPSDPNFRKTKGMDTIIQEKHKRKAVQGNQNQIQQYQAIVKPGKMKVEVSNLVKSVKRNSELLKKKSRNDKFTIN